MVSTARSIVERYIGRKLITHNIMLFKYPEYKFCNEVYEAVHHINGNPTDNRLENLYVFRNVGEHNHYHHKIRDWSIKLGGKTLEERIEYLKSFPELKSNLNELKELHQKGSTMTYYDEKH